MTETAILTSSDGSNGDSFGNSVAIFYDTVVVGVNEDSDNGWLSGSAYVFTMPAGGWVDMTETAKLLPSDGASGDRFGQAVSICCDKVVVGASHHAAFGPGAVYSYRKPAGGWRSMLESERLASPDAASGDEFGTAVALSRDGEEILVGAYGLESGSAYIISTAHDCNANGIRDECEIADGSSQDQNTNTMPDECECLADFNQDGVVDPFDLADLLGRWGVCGG